jgi:hypothetical protein
MRMRTLVDTYVDRDWGEEGFVIGVRWSAVGAVSPAIARRFAAAVLRAADRAEAVAARHKAKGQRVRWLSAN